MTLLCHNHGITGMKGARVSGNLSSNKMSYQTVRMDLYKIKFKRLHFSSNFLLTDICVFIVFANLGAHKNDTNVQFHDREEFVIMALSLNYCKSRSKIKLKISCRKS